MSSPSSKSTGESRDALASLRINRDEAANPRVGRRVWPLLLVVVAVGIGGWFWYRGGDASGLLGDRSQWVPEIMQNRVEVRLAPVTVQTGRAADAVVVATGYLESRRQARIGARAPGRIDVIHVEEGTRVTKGEVLAELEHADLEASLAAAEASVSRAKALLAEQEVAIEQARVDNDRAKKLWNQRTISEAEVDDARFAHLIAVARKDSILADIELADARRREAQQLKENMFIRAPFDGTVISKDAEVGESILPGGMGDASGRGSVATIADLDHLEIECDVQEDFIARISESQDAEISVDAVSHKKYHGIVRKIIPMGDRARATIKVKVTIADADELLFPEMSGNVFFLPNQDQSAVEEEEPRIFCPSKAVTTDAEDVSRVWVVDADKHSQAVLVEVGETRDGRTEILAGLSGDERVVVNPQQLQVGTPVVIVE